MPIVLVPFPDFSPSSSNKPTTTTTTTTTTPQTTTTTSTASPNSTWEAQARGMPDVVAFLAAHQLINAIKLVRERLGCGLKEAKDVAEAIAAQPSGPTTPWTPSSSSAAAAPEPEPAPSSLEPPIDRMRKNDEVMALVRRPDQKITAIKRVRELTGLGLKDSMDLVVALAAEAG